MRRTNIYLDEEQTGALDERARREGISRAELVRRLVERGLSGPPADVAGDLEAIEGSFGVLAGEPPHRRADGAREAHLDRVRSR